MNDVEGFRCNRQIDVYYFHFRPQNEAEGRRIIERMRKFLGCIQDEHQNEEQQENPNSATNENFVSPPTPPRPSPRNQEVAATVHNEC